jgi:hypothetical protein
VQQARLELQAGRPGEAARILGQVADDAGDVTLGPELRADVEHWRAVVAQRSNARAEAATRQATAVALIDGIRTTFAPDARERYSSRSAIQTILQGTIFN